MGADSLDENTPNAPEFICPICLPKPKSSGFQWKKASLGVCSPWILTRMKRLSVSSATQFLGQTKKRDNVFLKTKKLRQKKAVTKYKLFSQISTQMEKNCDRVQENRRRGSAVFFLPIMDDQMSVCNSVKCGHILYEFACSEIRKYGTPIFAKIY